MLRFTQLLPKVVLYWASKTANERNHWNAPKFGYEPGQVEKTAWIGFISRFNFISWCLTLLHCLGLHLGNCFYVYDELLSHCYWIIIIIIMIYNKSWYLYFTGSQNQSSPLQQPDQYLVSSQRCHPMLIAHPWHLRAKVLQFHFTHLA